LYKDFSTDDTAVESYLLCPEMKMRLFWLVAQVWRTEIAPAQLLQVTQIMLWKGKKSPEIRAGYRAISMTQAAYRLLAMVLLIRLETETNNYVPESQAGGMAGRATLNPLTVVTLTVARILETGEEFAMLLTDYSSAFTSTEAAPMDDSMVEAGASPKARAILRMIDAGTTYRVRGRTGMGETLSRPYVAGKGAMIGCASSPRRFIVALHYVLMQTDSGRRQLGPGEPGGEYVPGRDRVTRCGWCERAYAAAEDDKTEPGLEGVCPTCRTVSRAGDRAEAAAAETIAAAERM
jgi:hypothetical protein